MWSLVKQFAMLSLITIVLPCLTQGCNKKEPKEPQEYVKSGIQTALATGDYSEIVNELYGYCSPKEIVNSTTCANLISDIYREHENSYSNINSFYKAIQSDTNLLYSIIESVIMNNNIDMFNKISADIKRNISNSSLIEVLTIYDSMTRYCSPRFSEAINDYNTTGCLNFKYFKANMTFECYNALVTKVIPKPIYCR